VESPSWIISLALALSISLPSSFFYLESIWNREGEGEGEGD
jgi:hypothetical protein